MALHFQKANCVAVGAFNIYIVQPQWLAAKQLLPSDLEVVIESKLDEPGFRFTSETLRVRWLVTPTRIIIETEEPTEDCGQIMAQLLHWLPETPLVAVGNNAYYFATCEETDGMPALPDYPVHKPMPGYTLQQRSFHIGVAGSDSSYNLQFSLTSEGIELLTNAHGQIGKRGTKFAQDHARKFLDHRRTGVELARHHLQVNFHV